MTSDYAETSRQKAGRIVDEYTKLKMLPEMKFIVLENLLTNAIDCAVEEATKSNRWHQSVYDQGARDERSAIVAFLRSIPFVNMEDRIQMANVSQRIERCDHRKVEAVRYVVRKFYCSDDVLYVLFDTKQGKCMAHCCYDNEERAQEQADLLNAEFMA